MSKNLLIIGGTGFFGKSILDSFLKGQLEKFKISEIIVLSRSTNDFQVSYPEFICTNIKYISGDIATIDCLPVADIIIHAASSANQKDYITNSIREKENTENGVSNFIRLANKFNINSKIVYCSSGAVYGKQPNDLLNITEDFSFQDIENMPILKRDYTLSKRNAEKLIMKSGEDGLNVSIARCFAFYGKYLPEDGHFAYADFLKTAKEGRDIIVNSDHEVVRSYMHADKLVESLLTISLLSSTECPIYNVGSDIPISLFSLANKIAQEYNVKVITKSNIDFDNVDRYVPNIERLNTLVNG